MSECEHILDLLSSHGDGRGGPISLGCIFCYERVEYIRSSGPAFDAAALRRVAEMGDADETLFAPTPQHFARRLRAKAEELEQAP